MGNRERSEGELPCQESGRTLCSLRVRKAPKGSGDPRKGWECRTGVRRRDFGNDLARAGANRGAGGNRNPNEQDERTAGCRRSRSGALTSKWWPGNGQSFRESERPLRDAGSSQESWQVSLEALIRRVRKKAAGSRKDDARRSWLQSSVPLHAGGEFGCEIGSLGTISFFGQHARSCTVELGRIRQSARRRFSYSKPSVRSVPQWPIVRDRRRHRKPHPGSPPRRAS